MSSTEDDGPKLNVDDLLFFPAKELNESNIAGRRSPPQNIRLAIGRYGVYKFESHENKVLAFWGFKEIEDWNFSGYSFTLSFKNKKDYYVRTDDGQALSHWIESFSKNPEQAAVAAKQFKSLGLSGTMRKFSAELKPINSQHRYYTLNPRRGNKQHTIDSTRMLSAYGVDRNKSQTIPNSTPKSNEKDHQRWSTGTSALKKVQHKASTENSDFRSQSMESLISNGVHNKPTRSSPPPPKLTSSFETYITPKLPQSSITTTTHKSLSPPSSKVSNVLKQSNSNPCDATVTKNNELFADEEVPPAIPPRNASLYNLDTGHEYSVLEQQNENVLIKVSDEDLDKQKLTSPVRYRPHTYEDIEILPKSRKPYDKLTIMDSSLTPPSLPSSSLSESGEYDHLFPSKKGHSNAIRKKKNDQQKKEQDQKGEEKIRSPIRRNESLPPMTFHSPLLEKRPTTVDDKSDESDTEDESLSPLPPHEGIVFRVKKENGSDPFADLLLAPPSKSHLRWSQELNPIYDYTRGMKVSPAIAYEASSILAKKDQAIPEEETSSSFGDSVSIGSSTDLRSSTGSAFDNLVYIPQSGFDTAPRPTKRAHNYEEVVIGEEDGERPRTNSKTNRPLSDCKTFETVVLSGRDIDDKSATLSSPIRRLKSAENPQFAISPRLNKRVITRRSKTVRSVDDFNAPQGRQHAQKVADTLKDFSYINREYRLFYIKMPNGQLLTEVVNINRPVSVLIDKLVDMLGGASYDNFLMYVEGSVLTTMKEATLEFGEVQPAKVQVDRSVSLTQLVDSNSLAEQGSTPILLKNSQTFRMQNITTSRILRLDDGEEDSTEYPLITETNDFHKKWLGVVQGNHPCTLEAAVKLAAIQYQAYFLDRTAENSVVSFCRPNEFLPLELAGMRGIEQRMYKEQEKIKSKNQSDIQKFYIKYCCSLPTNDTIIFPVREARRRLFQSTRLKPVLLGVNRNGIMRVCPKTKEVLEFWEFQVLKNWAYSRRTFVIAFNDKNYPVESNQARWISELVDFFVDSIIHSAPTQPKSKA